MQVSKPTFTDLTPEEQQTFGNGCTIVPDFIFTASCRHHDFNYTRRGYVMDKLKADWDFCRHMWADSRKWWHYLFTVLYFLGVLLLPFSWFHFSYGSYRTREEILLRDRIAKMR